MTFQGVPKRGIKNLSVLVFITLFGALPYIYNVLIVFDRSSCANPHVPIQAVSGEVDQITYMDVFTCKWILMCLFRWPDFDYLFSSSYSDMVSPIYEFSCDSSGYQIETIFYHIPCSHMVSPLCGFSCDFSGGQIEKMFCHIPHSDLVSLLYES